MYTLSSNGLFNKSGAKLELSCMLQTTRWRGPEKELTERTRSIMMDNVTLVMEKFQWKKPEEGRHAMNSGGSVQNRMGLRRSCGGSNKSETMGPQRLRTNNDSI